MATFLVIDWDETECRYAVALLQKEQIVVQHLGQITLGMHESATPNDGDEKASPFDSLAVAVQAISKEKKLARCPMLISLGRNDVEWIQQQLPPAQESEIPLLLKNQALREISGYTEADALDYLVLETSSSGNRVLALLISQTYRKTLLRTFRSLGYSPVSIGYRATCTAEILRYHFSQAGILEGHTLVVNIVGNDVDIIMVSASHAVDHAYAGTHAERGDVDGARITAIRSFRLPAEQQYKNLADEIQRSLAIGLDGEGPVPVQHIVVFGDDVLSELSRYLPQDGVQKMQTLHALNPFSLPNVSLANTVRMESIQKPEQFAPLIGNLLIQSQSVKPAIDFLRPKEAPKPKNYTRPVLLGSALLVILFFGLYNSNQRFLGERQSELDRLKAQHQSVVNEIQQQMPVWHILSHTQFWETQNVIWLDVFKDLSEVLPSHTDLVVSQMSMSGPISTDSRFAASISFSGMVREPSVLQRLQSDLQSSGRYWVEHQPPRPNPAGGGYPWLFRTTVYRLR